MAGKGGALLLAGAGLLAVAASKKSTGSHGLVIGDDCIVYVKSKEIFNNYVKSQYRKIARDYPNRTLFDIAMEIVREATPENCSVYPNTPQTFSLLRLHTVVVSIITGSLEKEATFELLLDPKFIDFTDWYEVQSARF